MNQLDALRQWTTVVADTGDFKQISAYKPHDATTNPSLILKAVQKPEYRPLLDEAVRKHAGKPIDEVIDRLLVRFGTEILTLVPGRVSTEVDARLSFDTVATVERAQRLVALYRAEGIDTEKRLLIKTAATWEGIEAARVLEQQGIHCNLTLLFSFAQAVACGAARVQLISPFVGRIYDWYKKSKGVDDIPRADDPGVASVTRIYNYYKRFDYRTQVMGASFRKTTQILDLAGCDLLTISPDLMAKLDAEQGDVPAKLTPAGAKASGAERVKLDEPAFRWAHNEDAMGTDKLAEGIRVFAEDARKLESMLSQLAAAA